MLKSGENKTLVKADIEYRKVTIAMNDFKHMQRDSYPQYDISWMEYIDQSRVGSAVANPYAERAKSRAFEIRLPAQIERMG